MLCCYTFLTEIRFCVFPHLRHIEQCVISVVLFGGSVLLMLMWYIYIYIYPCDSIVHLNLFRSDLSLPTWSMGVLAALWRSSRLILNPTAKCSRMKLQLYREIFFTFRSETRLTDSLRCLDRMTSRHIFFVKDENWNFRVRLLRQSKGGQGCGEWSIMRHLNDVNCSISVGSGAGKLFNEVSFYGFTMRWMH